MNVSRCSDKAKKVMFLGLDGADPYITSRLIKEGRLPNIKKVMDKGTTTENMFMFCAVPTITPPNWASLATGAKPGTHGITCFWTHKESDPLDFLENGFNSRLCEAEFIWDTAAKAGKKCIVVNYPTSYPNTVSENLILVDGSSIGINGNCIIEKEKMISCVEGDFPIEENIISGLDNKGTDCMVVGDVQELKFDVDFDDDEEARWQKSDFGGIVTGVLEEATAGDPNHGNFNTITTPIKPNKGWKKELPVSTKEFVMPVNEGRENRYCLITPEKEWKIEVYTSKKEMEPIAKLYLDKWDEAIRDNFQMPTKQLKVAYRIKIVSMEPGKIQLYYSEVQDIDSTKFFYPYSIADELLKNVGPAPMHSNLANDEIDFETVTQMYDHQIKTTQYLMKNNEWDLFWSHIHGIDVCNHWYINKMFPEHEPERWQYYYDLVCKYYDLTDQYVGEMLKLADENTLVVVVSDHAATPKEHGCQTPLIGDSWNVGGKLMQDFGYLATKKVNGKNTIDWEHTKAVSQRAGHIYINLKGRDPQGIVDPKDYAKLQEQIIDDLLTYRDENGRRPIAIALKREDMPNIGLYGKHVGDVYFLFYSSWGRDHGTEFPTSTYKGTTQGSLFVMAGPGVKKGEVIKRHVNVIDIVPTVCHLTDIPVPAQAEGAVIYQALDE